MRPTKAEIAEVRCVLLGRSNALEAIDQAEEYQTLAEALDAYVVNLGDSLTELGLRNDVNERAALRGFEAVLIERGISERPVGM